MDAELLEACRESASQHGERSCADRLRESRLSYK
jgi:hypothetical protein